MMAVACLRSRGRTPGRTGVCLCESINRKDKSINRIALPLLTMALSLAPVLCSAFQATTELQKVIVEPNGKMTDAELAHLDPNIQMLDLRKAKVTDAGLVYLKGLTQLKSGFDARGYRNHRRWTC